MKSLTCALVFSLLLPLAGHAAPARQHIDENLGRFAAYINAGDAAGVAGLYTEDGALLPPNGERIDGRAAIQEFWKGAIDSGLKIELIRAVEVEARGDVAGEVGRFVLSVPGESGATRVSGKYIVIWKRIGHQWFLHRDIWNTDK